MKEVINLLKHDHKIVAEKINELEKNIHRPPETAFKDIVEILTMFKSFVFVGHHQRESEILYSWMKKQNANSDTLIIDRINLEHKTLEKLSLKILENCQNYLDKKCNLTTTAILDDLTTLVYDYNDHMVKEEKFIFMIAEALNLTPAEEQEMLERVKKSYN
jgi:hemerythrin-like domain-containing protein